MQCVERKATSLVQDVHIRGTVVAQARIILNNKKDDRVSAALS